MEKKNNPMNGIRKFSSRILLTLLSGLVSVTISFGQLSVNTVINPPFPTNLDYYIDDLSNLYLLSLIHI